MNGSNIVRDIGREENKIDIVEVIVVVLRKKEKVARRYINMSPEPRCSKDVLDETLVFTPKLMN